MVLLKVTVKNNTQETVYLPETDTAENEFDISVTDTGGHAVPLTLWGKTHKPRHGTHDVDTLSSRIIAPGKELTYQFLLNRHFDMTLGGMFFVVVTRTNIPDKDGKGMLRLVSNRASIMLLDPDPEIVDPEGTMHR